MKREKIHILVVDDEDDNRWIAARNLKKLGFGEVDETGSGEEAVGILKSNAGIDIVFLDRMMPNMSGLDLAKEILGIQKGLLPTVIFQTGRVSLDDLQEVIDVGVVNIMKKPYGKEEMDTFFTASAYEVLRKRYFIDALSDVSEKENIEGKESFEVITLQDAKDLAVKLARRTNDPIMKAIGLYELMANAVEHGYVKIGDDEKLELMKVGKYEDEVNARAESINKKVIVDVTPVDGSYSFTVTDTGEGFDSAGYMQPTPETILKPFYCGIPRAKYVFSSLIYNEGGNSVTAI